MNDERNVRVLFERALSVLPAEESVEVRAPLSFCSVDHFGNIYSTKCLVFNEEQLEDVQRLMGLLGQIWNRFLAFEQIYGDLASILKV